jgi:hypothetical protein
LHHGIINCLTIHDEVVAVSQGRVPHHRTPQSGSAPPTRQQNHPRVPAGPYGTGSGRVDSGCEVGGVGAELGN